MLRILLLLFIAFLVFLVLRALYRSITRKPPEGASPPAAEGEDMVACGRCGVNVPRSDTRDDGGRRVCAQNPNCR